MSPGSLHCGLYTGLSHSAEFIIVSLFADISAGPQDGFLLHALLTFGWWWLSRDVKLQVPIFFTGASSSVLLCHPSKAVFLNKRL